MQVQHIGAAGALMQIIHVLSNHRQTWDSGGHLNNREVGRVRLRLHYHHPSPFVPAPDEFRVAFESVGVGKILRPKSMP